MAKEQPALVVVQFPRSAAFKEREEGFSRYSGSSDEIEDDVHTDFIVTRNDQGACHSRLFHLNVASLLTGAPVANLFKYTNECGPRMSCQAWHRAFFWNRSGTGILILNPLSGIRRGNLFVGTKPNSLSAWSSEPLSMQLITNSSEASFRLRRASAIVLPWVVRSSGGQCAMYHSPSRFSSPKR